MNYIEVVKPGELIFFIYSSNFIIYFQHQNQTELEINGYLDGGETKQNDSRSVGKCTNKLGKFLSTDDVIFNRGKCDIFILFRLTMNQFSHVKSRAKCSQDFW